MRSRVLFACCAAAVAAVAWFSATRPDDLTSWDRVGNGLYRTKAAPHGYALVRDRRAVLFDATAAPDAVAELGVNSVEAVLLTHHHRDTAALAAEYRRKGWVVRAPKESAEWITPENVAKFWKESIPLRNSRTAYFVLPVGIEGVACDIADGKAFDFGGWRVTPVATPGHSRDHYAYLIADAKDAKQTAYIICGDAFCSAGKMWTPFTTDWDHWTDVGLKPAAESLRKLAKLNAAVLCPAHGAVLDKDVGKALEDTAKAVDEAAFLKSFERFTKERLRDAPQYDFLVPKEQVASAGEKPWARLSDHLWITGNTYVLKSTTGDGILVLDPWGQRSADQVEKLRRDEKLGPVEVVAFSHAHYDHFDGIHVLNGRDRCEVWALDLVAIPLKDPLKVRAPFLDPRPIKFTKELKDGETAAWGGYRFTFHHHPGQSYYTSAIETAIDGKRCLFTADNFFHQDQFSGSGGWMGLNRSSPSTYGASAKKVLAIAPEWVLAEHGGPYVFDKEDYRRRTKWAEAAAKACDELSVSGNHLRDWTPHRVTVEPVLQTATAGGRITVRVALGSLDPNDPGTTATFLGRGVFADQTVAPTPARSRDVTVDLPGDLAPGRHVFAVRVSDRSGTDLADPYFAVDVAKR